MTKVLKLTGIITIIIGGCLALFTLISGDVSTPNEIRHFFGGFVTYVFYGVVCLGLAKMIELLENRE